MRSVLCMIALMFAAIAGAQMSKPDSGNDSSRQSFAGQWWVNANLEERSGFLNGSADCLTWTAHKKGFNGTPEQLEGRITKYYKLHPEAASLSVVDVWEKVADQPKRNHAAEDQGETWKNAHWYLNGEWWSQSSEVQRLGFVEGYLFCLRTQVPDSTERYSRSAISYRQRIDAFVMAHPKQGKESIAVTLRRYRDQTGAPE